MAVFDIIKHVIMKSFTLPTKDLSDTRISLDRSTLRVYDAFNSVENLD